MKAGRTIFGGDWRVLGFAVLETGRQALNDLTAVLRHIHKMSAPSTALSAPVSAVHTGLEKKAMLCLAGVMSSISPDPSVFACFRSGGATTR